MNKPFRFLFTAGLGAAAMYYFDPVRGRYRRALVRDRLVHGEHKAMHGACVAGRDARNRAAGLAAGLRSMFGREQPDDALLVQRVRSCLGRVVTHPHSVKVDANDGVVTLSGPILEEEVPLLVDSTLGVPGVRDLKNRLEVHKVAGNVPGLQGGPRRRPGNRAALRRENWPPAARASGVAAGCTALLYGFGRGGLRGTLAGAAGFLLLTRAITNLELRRLFGVGAPRYAVDVQKNVRIQAPVDEVFGLWEDFENFPRFMTHVREVRPVDTTKGRQRWRWTVTGPTGTELEFDSVVVAREQNERLAWRTEGNAPLQHAGQVHFRDNGDGSTTVDIKMSYNPVVGAVGHAIARLLGSDPRHRMDEDLLRMKSYLETGKTPRHAAAGESVQPGQIH